MRKCQVHLCCGHLSYLIQMFLRCYLFLCVINAGDLPASSLTLLNAGGDPLQCLFSHVESKHSIGNIRESVFLTLKEEECI